MTDQDKIDELINTRSDVLTSWELSFISGVENQLANFRPLSPEQSKKLDEIYSRRVES